MSTRIPRFLGVLSAFAVLVLAAATWPQSPLGIGRIAYAGVNGTQVNYHTASGFKVCVSGSNQNFQGYSCPDSGAWFNTPNLDNPIANWWWIGTLTIDWYDLYGNYIETTYCNTNVSGDWVTCYGP